MAGEKVIVLTGAPADAAVIEEVNKQLVADGLPPWAPRVDYTITPCEKCGDGLWVGPRQRALRDELGPELVRILCMRHAEEYGQQNGGMDIGHLGGGDGAPRL